MHQRKKIKKINIALSNLIIMLKKKSKSSKSAIWLDIANKLSKSRRKRITVNISRIARYTKENDEVIIPGKVLGAGSIEHPVNVAALNFSDQARVKILDSKGKCLTIKELVEMNPKGTKVIVMG
jgi:large subunit ribosomal protein L18e